MTLNILIADDERAARFGMAKALAQADCRIDEAADGPAALAAIRSGLYDLVFLDLNMPGMDGQGVLRELAGANLSCDIVVVTANDTVQTAIACMKLGAADYLTKPYEIEQLRSWARRCSRRRDLERRVHDLQGQLDEKKAFGALVGMSRPMRELYQAMERVARAPVDVLIRGETGTGKELIARAIHSLSPRKDRPMIKVNCGAIPEGIVESELFGHEKGAFTGALQRRIGRFELADKGTLFMDEVGELPLETQVKLLRVLQEQEFERLGGVRPINVDVRLVAATNRDLDVEVANARFRADLYYRLNVFPVRIPPLRERPEDIPDLVRHFVAHFQRKLAKSLRGVTADGMERLKAYPWPGNIRELQNVLERACVLARGPIIDVTAALGQTDHPVPESVAVADERILTLDEHEQLQIRRALDEAAGKIHGPGGAAALLGINASTLRSRMEKHGMNRLVS